MKVRLYIENSEEKPEWRDFSLSEHEIVGFYIPDDEGDGFDGGVNVLVNGNMLTLKQEPHLVKYLEGK